MRVFGFTSDTFRNYDCFGVSFAVDEMAVETDLLKDMLANIAAKTSGIEENNTFVYGDCIYSITDSRGSST